jgi:hypothetical protein
MKNRRNHLLNLGDDEVVEKSWHRTNEPEEELLSLVSTEKGEDIKFIDVILKVILRNTRSY